MSIFNPSDINVIAILLFSALSLLIGFILGGSDK